MMRRIGTALFILLLIVTLAVPSGADNFYADANMPDDNGDGRSWTTAKRTIQAAITAAAQDQVSPTDEVRIKGYAGGTPYYNEHIEMAEGVSVKGAYTGNTPDLQDPENCVTVISGSGISDCVVYVPSGVSTGTALDCVTVTSGIGRSVSTYRYGGGIYAVGSPTISNCRITSNTASYGGGICATIDSAPSVLGCKIEANTANNGGGAYFYNGTWSGNEIFNNSIITTSGSGAGIYIGSYSGTSLVCTGNNLHSNQTGSYGWGGGVYMTNVSVAADFSGNDINENVAGQGGGICSSRGCSIVDNEITGNSQTYSGIAGAGGAGIALSSSTGAVAGNIISGNTAVAKGGGIYCYHCLDVSAVIDSNNIENNTSGSDGGGVYLENYVNQSLRYTFTRNRLSGNTVAGNGGGIYCNNLPVGSIMYSNVIKDNTAGSTGDGVYLYSPRIDTIFANNTVVNSTSGGTTPCAVHLYAPQGAGIYNNIISNGSGYGIYQSGTGSYTKSKNCLYNNGVGPYYPTSQQQGTDILDDPMLDTDGYHIIFGSPCIDAGDDSVVQTGWLDVDGEPRQVDIPGVGTALVDIGADEYYPPSPRIAVDPVSFEKTIQRGTGAQDILEVSNVAGLGALNLDFTASVTGASGGGAYAWVDSRQPGGPSFNWIDISTTGIPISSLGQDNYVGPITPTGFSFPFYGSTYSQFYIAENGWIGFGPPDGYYWASGNPVPHTASPNNAVYWLWGNLCLRPDSTIHYENRSEGLVVQFTNCGINSLDAERITAEVIFKPDGEILIQYLSLSASWPQSYGTVGIENADGTQGLQVAYNEPYIAPNLAVRFRQGDWLRVNPLSGSVSAGQSTPLTVTFDTGGLAEGDYSATIQVQSNDPDTPVVSVPVAVHIHDPVATPAFNPSGGTYETEQDVVISCATEGVDIYYTTDDTEPTKNSTLYTGPVHIDHNVRLKARAFKTNWPDSNEKSANYYFQVAQPTFTPDGGVCSSAPDVTLGCATTGAEIHYTVDGSEPTVSSQLYSSPIPVSDGTTLRAKSFRTDWVDSIEKTASYSIAPYYGAIVTAVFPDFFYVEMEDRSRGIRVDKLAHGLTVGARVDIIGTEAANLDGERYIEANSVTQTGTGEVDPIAINNRAIGGGPDGYHPGIAGAFGWNNTGMLVKVWGNITYIDSSGGYFYIDDGSVLNDGSGHTGVKVLAPAGYDLGTLADGMHVIITGISSCFKNDQIRRLIRVMTQDDIAVISDPGESFTFTLYQSRYNWFSLPLAPFDSNPTSVITDFSYLYLRRLDPLTGQQLTYSYNQSFGHLLLGDGLQAQSQWYAARTYTYYGFPDGLRVDNGTMSDMCICLPGRTGQQGGTHWIGHPFNRNVEWAKCLVTDGFRTIPVWDDNELTDDAVHLEWLDMDWQYKDNQTNTTLSVDPSGGHGSQYLEPGRMYEVVTHKSNLALIVPVVDLTPPYPPTVTDDGQYTNNNTQLHATWVASDPDSGIKGYQYAVGHTPTPPENPGDLVVPWTMCGTDTSATLAGLSLEERGTYYFYVKAKNGTGLWSNAGSSDGISIDTVEPTSGTASVEPGANVTPVTVTYTGASDDFSGLNKVELWYKKGSTGAWADSGSCGTGTAGSISFFATEDDTYYFALVAEDNAGNSSAIPIGDGDCQTAFSSGPGTSGRAYIRNDYLYTGGPLTQTTVYDEAGNQVRQVSQSYGNEGELLSTSGSTEPVSVTYDSLYRVKSITDGNEHTTTYTYDAVDGSLNEIKYPGGDAVQYQMHYPVNLYDPNAPADDRVLYLKRLTGKYVGEQFNIDEGTETRFIYDDPGNLLSHIKYPATPSNDVHFVYDGYGRLSKMWDGAEDTNPTIGKKEYEYDNLNLVTKATTTYAGLPPKEISYGYYNDGRLSTMTIPGTGSFSCNYDTYGRPTDLTNPYGETFSWTYKLNDWLETQTLKNNSQPQQEVVAQTTYDYNPRGLLTSLLNQSSSGSTLSRFGGSTSQTRMSYDTVGNLQSMFADIPGVSAHSGLTGYTYDTANPLGPRDQLKQEESARGGGYTNTFGYDSAGNPTTFRGASPQSFNSNNQKDAAGFNFDNRGNPTTYKGVSLAFDAENRMKTYGSALTAGYTGDGLRAYKTSASGTRYFLYDGVTPVCEMDASGNVTATNTFGVNGLVARREGSASVFYTFDPQGNVTQVLNPDNPEDPVTSNLLYDSYGNRLSADSTEPYGFGGQAGYYTDPETGLVLATNRYYDPAEGRWLTRDPVGYASGLNLYGYVSGNPINLLDPSGFYEDLPVNVRCGHDVAVLGAAGAAMANQEILDDQKPGALGIAKSTVLTSLNDGGAMILGVLDFGTGTAKFVEKPSLETAGGLCQDIATAAGAVGGGLSLGAKLSSKLGAANQIVGEGTTVYRVYGGESAKYGHSWTPVNPRTIPNYRNASGLPNVNTGKFLVEGTLKDATGVTTRGALELDGNAGGLSEYLIPDPHSQVMINKVYVNRPPF